MKIKIGDRLIGDGQPCYIIAEVGVNHNGSLKTAKKLIDLGSDIGVDAIKFQTFKTDKIVTKTTEKASYQKTNATEKEHQYGMLKKLELSYNDFKILKAYCDKKGITFLSTPHSCEEDADFLDSLGIPAFKIGSGDLTNIPFLEYIAKKGKPVILSTGMSTLNEVIEAVNSIRRYNNSIVLLHCTTNYPCPPEEVNLRAMETMKKEIGCLTGYSDHTIGSVVPVLATAMGACIIEKHFTLDKKMPGPDHKASSEPWELKIMVEKIRNLPKLNDILSELLNSEAVLGNGIKKPTNSEKKIMGVVRKSIVAYTDIPKGTTITQDMICIKRPGIGLQPKYFKRVIGRTAKRNILKDTLITWNELR